MKQTAVEWFAKQISDIIDITPLSQKQEEKFIYTTNKALEMEQVQDTKRLLFHYKVSLIIGLKKTGQLLKEVEQELIKSE